MATIIVPPTPSADPSMAELRAMVAGTSPVVPADEPAKPETSETPAAEKPVEAKPETATETVETKPNTETQEEELPEGVKKRIAKEAERAARVQSEIDQAVSARKAKEAELEKLKAGEKGSEPVNPPQSQANERPKRPALGEAGHETETWEQYQARDNAYEEARDKWLRDEAVRDFEQKQATAQAEKTRRERWDAAVTKHGKDFPALMDSARALAPEGLQVAISSLDNWDAVAVHLAKNPTQLQELASAFQQNPTKAIATLGRIEAALTSEPKPAATPEKPLPEPLKKVGGTASASGEDFQSQVENGSIANLRSMVQKLKKK